MLIKRGIFKKPAAAWRGKNRDNTTTQSRKQKTPFRNATRRPGATTTEEKHDNNTEKPEFDRYIIYNAIKI